MCVTFFQLKSLCIQDFPLLPISSRVSLFKFNTNLRGELTLVISDMKTKKKSLNHLNESIKKQIKNMSKKYSSKDIVSFISAKENIPKKIIYEFCIKMKK